MLWQVCKNGIPSTHCIVLYLKIYKAPLTVHTNQRRKVWDHSPVWQQYIYPQILSARNRFFELANGRELRCMICSDEYSLLSTINSILILTIKMVHFITIMNSGGEWGWGVQGGAVAPGGHLRGAELWLPGIFLSATIMRYNEYPCRLQLSTGIRWLALPVCVSPPLVAQLTVHCFAN